MGNSRSKFSKWRLGALAAVAAGVLASQPAFAGIAETKHNLGSGGLGVNKFDGTAELCVFCHTPHGSDATASVPLWNRTMAAPSTYTTYNSLGTSSLDGKTAPVGSVSLACLSCHDGVQAMNSMINQPGSGGYNVGGAELAGNWTGANQSAGKLVAGAITNIGQNLADDHPIGIQYAGGPKSGTVPAAGNAYNATMFRKSDFAATASTALNGQPVWWVDSAGGTAGTKEKGDLQLYTRTDANSISSAGAVTSGGIAGTQPFVECASCHDPHTSENAAFLRISNAGSSLCLTCHVK